MRLQRFAFAALLVLCSFSPFWGSVAHAGSSGPLVLVLNANGPVGPTMAAYLDRGLHLAEERRAELVIIEMDTPGGDGDSMLAIVQTLQSSRVPVVVYVAPRGARAASAGAVITLAAHASAMAPATTIGAASPVDAEGQDLGETMKSKIIEDMKARVRTLTARRPPEAMAFAEQMIENAKAATAEEALAMGLVDFIATGQEDLLRQLDGLTLETADGPHTLHTAGAVVNPLNLLLIEQVLLILANPNIVFLLMLTGVIAIIIELASPGGWVAGFIGVISLALATYGLGLLPVNWFGLIFLGLAFGLFILDLKAPTHGALTAAGAVSLAVGGLVLFNSPGTPDFQRVSVPLVIGSAVVTAALLFPILMLAWRVRHRPIVAGQESLIGKVGVVRAALAPRGSVQLTGELWSAEAAEGEAPLPEKTRVSVVHVQGIRLIVRRAEEPQPAEDLPPAAS